MKRTICIIGILAIVLNLFGCGLVYIPGTSETEKKRIEESAEKHLNNVLSALESGDKEAFENLFTNDVKEQNDFQIGVDYTFKFYYENILSFKDTLSYEIKCYHTGETYGKREEYCERVTILYLLNVGDAQYNLSFLLYLEHGTEKNKGKMSAFELISANDKYNNLYEKSGVFYPGWRD